MRRAVEVLADGTHLRLVRTGRWEFVQRTKATGIVIIAAMTPEHEVLFVRQHRPAVDSDVIELPAGLAGDVDAGEALAKAAQRELLEETGYRANRLTEVFCGPSSAGLSDELVTIFVADQLVQEQAGGGVEGEKITNLSIPLDQVDSWLEQQQQQQGVLVGARVYSGLYLLRRYLASPAS